MPYRSLWQIDMGDGTWAVCCMACRLALYRGPKAGADRAAASHHCEPVVPLGRRRRRRPSRGPTRAPVGGASPDPRLWTDAPPTANSTTTRSSS